MYEEWKGDFLGFEFAGKHSDIFNIVRTSDSDRFSESLQPEINDITAEIPGMDGNYYFGSTYGNKTISVSFAFDHLTEKQFRDMRKWLGRKQMGELIFDERPYKKYIAKIESPIELSYVCFDEPRKQVVGTAVNDERYGVRWVENIVSETVIDEETQEETTIETTIRERERIYPYEQLSGTERIYKGDGTIEFICYYPFAKSVFKQIPSGKEGSDWVISSGILSASDYAAFDTYNDGVFRIYNAGDVATGFRLCIASKPIQESEQNQEETEPAQEPQESQELEEFEEVEPESITIPAMTLTYSPQDQSGLLCPILAIDEFTLKDGDVGVMIDTNNGLIVGISSFGYKMDGNAEYTTSGNLYNEFVTSGYFFKFEPSDDYTGTLTIDSTLDINEMDILIFYDYLYF